jgi:hypothetical protein
MAEAAIKGSQADPEAVRSHVERLLASNQFRDSPIQQRLLRFLVDEALANRGGSLKEYTIGEAVFQRGSDFDPRTDSIVRVQVGVLRKKLASYYDGVGTSDQLLIGIPRGHYEPVFTTRPVPSRDPDSLPGNEVAPGAPMRRRLPGWAYGLLGILLGGLLVLALDPRRPAESIARQGKLASNWSGPEWREHPLWKGFFEPGANTRLVIGVPLMVGLGGGFLVRDTQVNRPEDLSRSEFLRQIPTLPGPQPRIAEIYTGLGEATGVSLLTRFFRGASIDLPLIRNRLTRWQDLSAGNVIFIASLRFRTLGQELNRPAHFEFASLSPVRTALRNLRPKAGEPSLYESSMTNTENGNDYALVTVWPGTLAGRRIMAIGGSHTWGTEGAAEYITDAESLRDLRSKLNSDSLPGRSYGSLQIVLRIEVKDSQVVSAEYVTHHWIQ